MLPLRPSEYFARQCWITSEPDEKALPAVVSALGDSNLLFASDYPHPDGRFAGVVSALADRTDLPATLRRILCDNPLRLFGQR